ncbi:MAG: 2-phosphosulfolactate phosphatase [Anaerolineaceae bacterium]
MEIHRATLDTCHTASGLVVVIDVLRAFTTSAYLFQAGADEIILVSGVDEAFQLRKEIPDSIIVGEVDGIQVPGFDLGNSPSRIETYGPVRSRVILRTTAGTQGVILARKASTILTTALTNVTATVHYIQNLAPSTVTLIQTGLFAEKGWGDEDVACADVIENLLFGKTIDWDVIYQRVRSSKSGSHYDSTREDFPSGDLELVLQHDSFNFAMVVERKNALHRMHCETV